LRDTVVELAATAGDPALYDRYLAASRPRPILRSTTATYALAHFSEAALVRRTIDLILSPDVRPQDVPGFLATLLRDLDGHDYAWTLLRQRWDDLQKKVGPSWATGGVGALGSFCSAEKAAEIRQFFAAHPVLDAQRTLQQALEQVDICAAVRSAGAVLARWLEKRIVGRASGRLIGGPEGPPPPADPKVRYACGARQRAGARPGLPAAGPTSPMMIA
jgi:hypothetical protein